MNIQELATAAEENLDIKVIILNNGHLGLVRQQQSLFYGENHNAVKFHQRTDFALLAQSMGVAGIDLGNSETPVDDLHEVLLQPGPCIINLPIHEQEMVFPMVPPGGSNKDMIGGEAR
jgi:acetolactate synthase-1/2/3 large subunit